jgi:methylglutaconyl-CoA hydratase
MSELLVLYDVRPPAALLTLNRPASRNAISRGLIRALADAFRRAQDDPAVRSVILTGAGSVFCAGMDLAELSETLERTETKSIWDDAQQLAILLDQIFSLPKPTIAAVNGAAVAGGAGFVTSCDLALAVPEARLGYPEVRRGLVAAMVMPHLLRHVGERMARFLLLTGELITAEEARCAGLINEVVPAGELLDRAFVLARALALGGPNAQAGTKALLKQLAQPPLSVEETARASAAPRLSEECQQGLRAFFNKLPAPWEKV